MNRYTKLLPCAYILCHALHEKVLPIGYFSDRTVEGVSKYWQSTHLPESSYFPPRETTIALAVKFVDRHYQNTPELLRQLDSALPNDLYHKYDVRDKTLTDLTGAKL